MMAASRAFITRLTIAAILALSLVGSAGQASADPGQTAEDLLGVTWETLGSTWESLLGVTWE